MKKEEMKKAIQDNYPPEIYTRLREAIDYCINMLTPPTSDEVCKALSEWLSEEIPELWVKKVYHDNGGFHYYNNEDYEIYLVDYDEIFERIFFPRYLPPRLITLIGRFYEAQQ